MSGPIVVPTLVDIAKKTMPSPNRDLGTILLDIVKTKIVSILNPIPCSALMNIKNPMESFTKVRAIVPMKYRREIMRSNFILTFWIITLAKKRVISDAVIKVVVIIPAIVGLSLMVDTKIGKPAVII